MFTTIAQTPFQFGSITGGNDLNAAQEFFPLRPKKVKITRKRISLPLSLIQKKFNSFEPSTLPGFLVGNTGRKIICLIHFPSLWSTFTKSSGGMNIKQNYVAKRMWNFSARQKRRSSLSTISIHLRRRKKLILDLLLQSNKKVQQLQQRQKLKDYFKRNEKSLNFSKIIPICDKFFFKKFWTKRMT